MADETPDTIERLAAAIEHTAWMQAATQAAGLRGPPRGCSREDFAAARIELRAAIAGALPASADDAGGASSE